MRTVKTAERFEDTIVETSTTIETRPAVIDYRDILEACEVVSDDDMGAPWKECDGWEHDVERTSHDGQKDARGYSRERDRIITPTDSDLRDSFAHYRERGCSKQTAAELVALAKRNRTDTIVGWYENGYEWWMVTGEYLGRFASCGGIDGYDYANDDVRHEIAEEIASQLEDDGYTITHRPDPVKRDRQSKRDRLKRNLTLDCWTD